MLEAYTMHNKSVAVETEVIPRPYRNQTTELRPGLTALVEIETRMRCVLTYLTKPISKTLSQSMYER
jgi:hypothetical protein